MQREWEWQVKIVITGIGLDAKTEKEAVKQIKGIMYESYGITKLQRKEIVRLKRVKVGYAHSDKRR